MRIISGIYKGRTFKGKIPDGIRPTQDAMRETIFNVLRNHADINGAKTADICSGTGAMGIEAISRGAVHTDFIDLSRKSCDYVKAVLNDLEIDKNIYNVYQSDAVKYVKNNTYNEYDLIFTDPPYSANIINQIVHYAVVNNHIKKGGIIIAELAITSAIILPAECEICAEKTFSGAKTIFIKRS